MHAGRDVECGRHLVSSRRLPQWVRIQSKSVAMAGEGLRTPEEVIEPHFLPVKDCDAGRARRSVRRESFSSAATLDGNVQRTIEWLQLVSRYKQTERRNGCREMERAHTLTPVGSSSKLHAVGRERAAKSA